MSESWVFTFGVGHALAGHYVELRGSHDEAREEMFRLFGPNWAFQYDNIKGAELIERYGYKPLRVNSTACVVRDDEVDV
jgi:hypothetical protein